VSQHARPESHAVPGAAPAARSQPSPSNIKRWRQYLADERAEAAVYRDLAQNRGGEERAILLALAEAEGRHEAHWLALLGEHAGKPKRASARSRFLGFLARHFGSVFVLALAQRAEGRSPYAKDPNATEAMRWSGGWQPAAATGWPARSVPPSSAPTTAWSATSPW
jgi:hypothetical protein